MHFRGPMNVSQLAVYQLPSERHTMQKRHTVPFYNRRRSLKERETRFNAAFNRDARYAATADWSRVAYYTSTAPAQATGLSFLANLGDPQKSGTFD